MKIKTLAIFVILLITNNINSQTNKTKTTEKTKYSYVTFNAFSPSISYAPRWSFGYYKKLNERYILGAEIGYGNYDTSINFAKEGDWIEKDYFSYEISSELIYLLNPEQRSKNFISVELFYINHKDKLKNETYKNETDHNYYFYDSADYQRQKFGFNLNFGMLINLSKRIGIIPKIGLGLKMRNVEFSNIQNQQLDSNYEENSNNIFSVDNFQTIEGFNTRMNFNLEFHVIYKLN